MSAPAAFSSGLYLAYKYENVPGSFCHSKNLSITLPKMSTDIGVDEFTSITTRQKQLNFDSSKPIEVDQRVINGTALLGQMERLGLIDGSHAKRNPDNKRDTFRGVRLGS